MGRVLRWVLIPPAVLLALLLLVPFVVSISSFLPDITRIAGEKLGQPVAIADIRLEMLPTPRIVARGIVVGQRSDAKVQTLEIVPDLMALLDGEKAISMIRAEKVELQESALAIPGGMPKGEGGEPITLRRVLLKEVQLDHATLKLPALDVDAKLGPKLALETAKIDFPDGSLVLTVKPEAAQAAIYDVEGRLYGGAVKATARLDTAKLVQLGGKATVDGVDLARVQRLLGKKPQLSGRLKADAAFSGKAKSLDQLANVLALDGPFEVLGGAYQGVDLSKAADLTGKPGVGDATKFEELKGKLQVRGKRVRVNELCVRSPSVVAGGNVEVAPDQKLSGRLQVSLAKTGGVVGVPVSLGGTTASPSITPTKGYVMGAVIGTVLLPGIGTGLGASAGSALEGKSGCK